MTRELTQDIFLKNIFTCCNGNVLSIFVFVFNETRTDRK